MKKQLNLPEQTEFTTTDTARLNEVSHTTAYNFLKGKLSSGVVKEIRRESKGKGKPAAIYSKA